MGKKELNNNELMDKKIYLKHHMFKETQNKHYKEKNMD